MLLFRCVQNNSVGFPRCRFSMEPLNVNCVKTFAVLDLETTGLPSLEFNKTKITELSIVAATRSHIIDAVNAKEKLPRVLSKLNICFYPQRLISAVSSEVTGLYNDMLEDYKPFDEDAFTLLEKFLQRLPEPVCIISHNGLRFDFPILQTELQKLGKRLPDTLLCADSLSAFRQLLGSRAEETRSKLNKTIVSLPAPDTVVNGNNESTNSLYDSDEYDQILYSAVEKLEAQNLENANSDIAAVTPDEAKSTSLQQIDFQAINEKTPNRMTTPKPIIPRKTEVPKREPRPNAKRRLFPSGIETKVLKRFRLGDVYQFLLEEEPEGSHRAENDVLNLMKCIVMEGSDFAEWVDMNARIFNSVPELR